MTKSKKRVSKYRKFVLLVSFCAIIFLVLWFTNIGHIFRTAPVSNTRALTTKSNFNSNYTSSGSTNKKPSTNNGVAQGSSTDLNGSQATPITSFQTQWAVSQSGAITLKNPLSGATIQSGFDLEGTATVTQIQYTLIDNQVGVISQGTISVVNGSFSATVNFTPTASSGRLDVYSTETNGKQENEIEIPVDFQGQ